MSILIRVLVAISIGMASAFAINDSDRYVTNSIVASVASFATLMILYPQRKLFIYFVEYNKNRVGVGVIAARTHDEAFSSVASRHKNKIAVYEEDGSEYILEA